MTSASTILLFAQVVLLFHDLPQATAVSPSSPSVSIHPTDLGCPPAPEIDPCVCTVDGATADINMDCSDLIDNAQLKKVFEADFLFPDLNKLVIQGTTGRVGIRKLEADTFGKVSFKHITISYTELNTVEASAFANSFPTIQTMEVTDNLFEFFPFEILAECEKLETLYVQNNMLKHVSVLHSNSLTHFDASGNSDLKYEDEIFQTAPMLATINLSNIGLGHIAPLTFAYQQRLSSLELQNNNIDYLYENALKFMSSSVISLNLDNNRIGTVESNAITGNSNDHAVIWL